MNTTQHSGQNPYGAGQPFQAGQPGQPGQYQAVPVEQPKKKKKWPWIVGILAVLVVGGMITGGDSDETTTAEIDHIRGCPGRHCRSRRRTGGGPG
ncbi:hypothetical protein [Corynebacterium suedekumii]|uniref:Uncharacterized protein n=1 Tax=Corynebacterium suedekumii TaxID=3049801 RepID=A0ABY8VPN6_9CORY|nr:hypothetical protein [Corynebacterium suedekumii]WIM71473.1 hypothetical protein QP029_06790 [Corynebacterium suedekumii]